MSSSSTIHLTLDRRLLRHPRAYHLRRMRLGVWLYLDLLARLPVGADTIEVEPAVVAGELGVEEGFVRSWLGHLQKAGYIRAERLNGKLRVSIKRDQVPEPIEPPRQRFFTVSRLERALADRSHPAEFEAALRDHPDAVIRKALAGALAVSESQIRVSRTALFFFLLKRYAHAHT